MEDFDQILKKIKAELITAFGDKWKDLSSESKKDIDQFLGDSEDKLKRWTFLLANGAIDLEDYEWLLKSQKDVMLMQTLYSAGISKLKIGHLKNKAIKTILSVVKTLVL